jgi:hypothetical protein
MRHGRQRRQRAAALYLVIGVLVLAIAFVTSSIVLLVVAGLFLLVAPVALYRYPIDRHW